MNRDYQFFKKHMKIIMNIFDYMEKIKELFGYSDDNTPFEILIDEHIKLLSIHFNDENEWIPYWIYDLDFGEQAHENSVLIDDKPVPVKTLEDLYYNIIVNNIKD